MCAKVRSCPSDDCNHARSRFSGVRVTLEVAPAVIDTATDSLSPIHYRIVRRGSGLSLLFENDIMKSLTRILWSSGLSMLLVACGSGQAQSEAQSAGKQSSSIKSGSIDAALAGPHRTPEERARDQYRHPSETLAFFGIEHAMTVVEVWPGRGWYTKILAPFLREEGKLIVATMDPQAEALRGEIVRGFRAMLDQHPELYGEVQRTTLYPPHFMDDVADASVDMVVSFRSVHNWIRWEGHEPEPYFEAIARVLKPGGTFGVVQHRAPADFPHAEDGEKGYLSEQLVIELAEKAGLEFVARSAINKNPADDHDHPEGVWSLPPVLRDGDKSLEQVGESDRMTLKFRKSRR